MPAKSEAQLRLMRLALAYKKGYVKDEVSQEVKDIAKSMTYKELKDFVKKAKGKKLPMHVDEEFATLDSVPGMGDVVAPTATSHGSGDIFNAYGLYTQGFLKNAKKDRKAKKTDPMKHYHPEKGIVHFQPHGTILHFQDFIKNLETKKHDDFTDHNDPKDSEGSVTSTGRYDAPFTMDGSFDGDGGGE